MSFFNVMNLLKDYIFLAIGVLIFALLLFYVIYNLIYKKICNGKKEIKLKKLILPGIFIGYLVIVFGATFLSRNSGYIDSINMNLFSSYKEAYIAGTQTAWLNIILNILLFVPMGFLLPLLSKKIDKFYKTIGIGFVVTFLIEFLQTITNMGIFEIDDIFNNTLGTIIGFCIVKLVFLIKNKEQNKKKIKAFVYLSPILLTSITFVIIFSLYNNQEFGNLPITPISRIDMSNVKIKNNIEKLNTEDLNSTVYQTKKLSEHDVIELAKKIFNDSNGEIDDRFKISFDEFDTSIHSTNNQIVRINYNGTYTLTYNALEKRENSNTNNYSSDMIGYAVYDAPSSYITDKEIVLDKLYALGIKFETDFTYCIDKNFNHIFTVNVANKEQLTSGSIVCRFQENGSYNITNNIINYTKAKNHQIISEKDAYKKIQDGEIRIYSNSKKIQSLELLAVNLDYMLDSKLFYQPVYIFDVYIDNSNNIDKIYVPAIK